MHLFVMRANVFLCSGVSTSKGGCLNSTAEIYLFTSTKVSSGSLPRLWFVPSSISICSGISAKVWAPQLPLLNLIPFLTFLTTDPISYRKLTPCSGFFWSSLVFGQRRKNDLQWHPKAILFPRLQKMLGPQTIIQKSDITLKNQNLWLHYQSFQLDWAIFNIVGLPIPVSPDNAHSDACIDPFLHWRFCNFFFEDLTNRFRINHTWRTW